MTKKIIFFIFGIFALSSCKNEDEKDMQKPEIRMDFPQNCKILQRGDSLIFHALFSDNAELGSYNIEIHHNFDHHSHSTDNAECEPEAKKQPSKDAWIFNRDYGIPAGRKEFEADIKIAVPAGIDTGDYHFMVRLTDRSGWQELKAASIKIKE
jgi:hypothetical protein